MARDHARIRLDIWADDDFRALPSSAQWLYLHLTSCPSLRFSGVADWRPPKIAAMAAETAAPDVEWTAGLLEHPESGCEPFLVIDRDTEEVLIRSFIKHDGLMKSPNMTTAMVNAYKEVASTPLRAVIIGQLVRLKESEPDLAGWSRVTPGMLRRAAMTPAEAMAKLPTNPAYDGPATLP